MPPRESLHNKVKYARNTITTYPIGISVILPQNWAVAVESWHEYVQVSCGLNPQNKVENSNARPTYHRLLIDMRSSSHHIKFRTLRTIASICYDAFIVCGRNSTVECQPSKLQTRHVNSLKNRDFHTSPGTASHSAATEKTSRENGQGDNVGHLDADNEPGNVPPWLRRELAEHFRKLASMTPKRRAAILALTDD